MSRPSCAKAYRRTGELGTVGPWSVAGRVRASARPEPNAWCLLRTLDLARLYVSYFTYPVTNFSRNCANVPISIASRIRCIRFK